VTIRDLSDLPLPWLKCRSFGHSWDEYRPVGKRKPSFGFRISLLCVSCTMERHDIVDTNGNLAARQYVEAEGYYDIGKWSRAEYRLAYNRKRRRTDLVRQRTEA
jgi:hypothetical protein